MPGSFWKKPRNVALLALAAAVGTALLAALLSGLGGPPLRGRVVAALESGLSVHASVGDVELSLLPLTVTARDVALDEDRGGRLLDARELRIHPSLGSLLGGRIDLPTMEVAGGTLRIVVRDGRAVNLPAVGGAGGSHAAFSRLTLRDATVLVDAEPLGSAKLVDATLELRPDGAAADALALSLRAERAELGHALGSLSLGQFAAHGTVGSAADARLSGIAKGDALGFSFDWKRDALAFRVAFELPSGGRTELAATLPSQGHTPPTLELAAERARLSELTARLGLTRPTPIEGELTGHAKLSGTLEPLSLGGPASLALERAVLPRGDAEPAWQRERIAIEARARLDRESLALHELALTTGESRLHGDAKTDAHGEHVELTLQGSGVDLADLGLPPSSGARGRGDVALALRGSRDALALEGRFDLEDAALGGLAFERASAGYRYEPATGALRVEELSLSQGKSRVRAERLERAGSDDRAVRGTLVLAPLRLQDLRASIPSLELPADVDAELGGPVELTWRPAQGEEHAALAVRGKLTAAHARARAVTLGAGKLAFAYDNQRFDDGLEAGRVELESLSLGKGAVHLGLRGHAAPDGALSAEIDARGLPLEVLTGVRELAPALSGTVAITGSVSGTRRAPAAKLQLRVSELEHAGRPLGAAKLRASLVAAGGEAGGDGCGALDAVLRADPLPAAAKRAWYVCGDALGGKAKLAFAVGTSPAFPLRGRLQVKRVDPLALLIPDHPGVDSTLSFDLRRLSGDLRAPETLFGQVDVDELALGVERYRLSNESPFVAQIAEGALRVERVSLRGKHSGLSLSGSVSAREGLALEAKGTVGAALLAQLSSVIERAYGDVDLELSLRGAVERPTLRGELSPRDVIVMLGGGVAVKRVTGRLSFQPGQLRVGKLEGELGGGTLEVRGQAALDGLEPTSCDLKLAARRVTLEPQARFELGLDADGRLLWEGGEQLPKVSGVVRLRHALYARHIELPEALVALNREDRERRSHGRGRIAFDVAIEHGEPLRVRNNFLDAELAVADPERGLRLVGTDRRFSLLGGLEVVRGRVIFRGDEFEVTRGNIAFEDPDRIDPRFDVRAIARLRRDQNTSVVLAASGNRDAFQVRVRCESGDVGEQVPPFACDYEDDRFHCDNFERLVQLWLCKPEGKLSGR